MNIRQQILSCLSKTELTPYANILGQFSENNQFLVEVLLSDLVEQGFVEVKTEGPQKSFLLKNVPKKIRQPKTKTLPHSEHYELTATLPESVLSEDPGVETTRASIRKLLSAKTKEILVSQPFIDNIFIDVFEDEIRTLAKNGIRFVILTRKVSTDTWSVKGLLRIFEMYSMQGHADKFEVYEHWVPLRTGKGSSKQYIGLHAKLVINDDDAYLGSANWTGYSLSNNFEIGMIISNYQTVSKLRSLFFLIARKSIRVDLKKIHQQLTNRKSDHYGRRKSHSNRF